MCREAAEKKVRETRQLYYAIYDGNVGTVRKLASAGAGVVNDVWVISQYLHWTPLLFAIWKGQKDIVVALLSAGADMQQQSWMMRWEGFPKLPREWLSDPSLFPTTGDLYTNHTPMTWAVVCGNKHTTALLFAHSAPPALYSPVTYGREVLSALDFAEMHCGATADTFSHVLCDRFDMAQVNLHDEKQLSQLLRLFPGMVGRFRTEEGEGILHKAAALGDATLLEKLLVDGSGAQVISNWFGMAVSEGHYGASVTGRTPLHHAAQGGHLEAVQVLLQRREFRHTGSFQADVNCVDRDNESALMLAAMDGHVEVVRFLLRQGGGVDFARKSDGKTALDILRSIGREEVAEELEQMGEINTRIEERCAALGRYYAAPGRLLAYSPHSQDAAVVRFLEGVRKGAYDPTSPTGLEKGPNTALHMALAYLSRLDLCSLSDAEEALEPVYGAKGGGEGAQRKGMSPLLLLARARLSRGAGNTAEAAAFYRLSQELAPTMASDWFTDEERDYGAKPFVPVLKARGITVRRAASDVEDKWEELKEMLTEEQRAPMEKLLGLVGLHEVKRVALSAYADVLANTRLKQNGYTNAVQPNAMNYAFVGNPGTGKTTVAQLFAQLLEQAGARAGHKFVHMTATEALRKGSNVFSTELASLTGGRPGVGPEGDDFRTGMNVEVLVNGKLYPAQIKRKCSQKLLYTVAFPDKTEMEDVPEKQLRHINKGGSGVGGVLFLDEAYDLDPAKNPEGKTILAEIMTAAEEHRGKLTIILAGYKQDIEDKLYSFNAGMPSRFQTVLFEDFTQEQLADVWKRFCGESEWDGSDLVTRVASHRVAAGIGRKGFGNARSVRVLFERAVSNAKLRYKEDRPTLLVEDVIGKRPTRENIPELDKALRELEQLVGLESVKRSVHELVQLATINYDRELRAEPVHYVCMNRLFLGNPGTGKVLFILLQCSYRQKCV